MEGKIRDKEVPDYIDLYDGCIRRADWILQDSIFYGKDVESSRVEKPISLLSLAPTIFHFIGLQGNERMQGKNVFETTGVYNSRSVERRENNRL